eukprot:m.319635 g.319635  ORF g.319635 m.319635 type:complete len:65 (-) comp20305_c0_seq20:53-247(-)
MCNVCSRLSAGEGKAISDLNAYYLLNEAKLTPNLRSLYTTCFGATVSQPPHAPHIDFNHCAAIS